MTALSNYVHFSICNSYSPNAGINETVRWLLALSRQEALKTKRVLLKVEFDQVVLQSIGAEGGREMTDAASDVDAGV